MDIKDAVYTRRSVRNYLDKPVDKAVIEQLIDAAIQAPNAMNSQPWAFGIVQGKDALAELSTRAKAYLLSVLDRMPALENYRSVLENPDLQRNSEKRANNFQSIILAWKACADADVAAHNSSQPAGASQLWQAWQDMPATIIRSNGHYLAVYADESCTCEGFRAVPLGARLLHVLSERS